METEGGTLLDTEDSRMELREDQAAALSNYLGKTVTVGIRPEHVYVKGHAVPPRVRQAPVSGVVDFVEALSTKSWRRQQAARIRQGDREGDILAIYLNR